MRWLTASAVLLAVLIGLDYLPLHDIFHDYISRAALGTQAAEGLSPLPAWTSAELEWTAVTVSFVLKAALATANVALCALLLRDDPATAAGMSARE
jgi:hypothetical protein